VFEISRKAPLKSILGKITSLFLGDRIESLPKRVYEPRTPLEVAKSQDIELDFDTHFEGTLKAEFVLLIREWNWRITTLIYGLFILEALHHEKA